MPISSHCFWPCDSRPARRCALARQVDAPQHGVDALALIKVEARGHRGARAAVGLQRELQVLEHREALEHAGLLELAADAGARHLALAQAQQVHRGAEPGAARVGPRLAGDDVHHGRLAGARWGR
jgi:hypothetical protein